ncbi:MAG: UDP-4-amino-4,6-dideoxy-N-acetyl-beta-L-altrosamine transaminase [Deltaproteobacteria bacterium]|nr:UDP-4-amino-4,6-dideoxy-N-acetyl-beta-L-altrosamine transaminase [Deltaproteobacteria bacterium]MBW2152329.1 UDP-4-amino-4,6-dideoxy-N-acetyl-beta-L-altrosamine transaminase [Deltaproteobacteria bacterium]
MKEKIFFDSNIFIYAADKKSLFYDESIGIIKDYIQKGFCTCDLCFLEFYQVITDGRKTPKPLSPQDALRYVKKMWDTPEIDVLEVDILRTFLEHQEDLVRYNITKFGVYDYLIAACLKRERIEKIATFNGKDFMQYPWLTVVDPRETYGSRSSAPFSGLRAPRFIPYGRQSISEQDVAAVCKVLRSDWLTTGPKVSAFEEAVSNFVGAAHAVAVSSGTAALHCAMYAAGIGPGDEVILPSITFAATANVVVILGAKPVFVDVTSDTLLIDPEKVEASLTSVTKALVAVDYTGHPCAYDELREIARRNNLVLIADACHSIGGTYHGRPVGSLADLTVFSFHPVKHITTGEGGMIVTDNSEYADMMRKFRNHGISADFQERRQKGDWYYEIWEPGYNYRITDLQCALGLSQLARLREFLSRRRELAATYNVSFASVPEISTLSVSEKVDHAYHLYVVQIPFKQLGKDRRSLFRYMNQHGVAVNVHYLPVHLHPFYRKRFGTGSGMCPIAEAAYEKLLTLPLFPALKKDDQMYIIKTLLSFLEE